MYEVIRIVFYCYLVVTVYKADVTIDTVCYGPPGLSCTTHQLSCTDGLVIDIINKTYGYRSGCNSLGTGIANCIDTTCCTEHLSDCFLPFDLSDTLNITRECEGSQRCTSSGYRKSNVGCNGSRYSSYSRVEYVCIQGTSGSTQIVYITGTGASTQIVDTSTTDKIKRTKGTGGTQSRNNTSTTDQTTRTTDTGAVVGGVIGVLVVVGVLLAVGFFIYRRKRMRKTDENNDISQINVASQHQDPNYYTIDNVTRPSTNNTVDYDEVDLNGPPSKSPSGGNYDHIENNSTPSHQKNDNYNHIVSNGAVVLQDDYHHVRADNSNELSNVDYNHIGFTSTAMRDNLRHPITEDDYNHIGSKDNIISDECDYNHIGGKDISDQARADDYHHITGSGNSEQVREDDYNHINGSRSHDHVSEDDYNHINGSRNNDEVREDNYNHINGSGNQDHVSEDNYNHIGEVNFPNHGVASTGEYELASLTEYNV